MWGCRLARESADGEIERTPPEMHRTGFAGKFRTESRKNREHCSQRLTKTCAGLAAVIARPDIVGERGSVRQFAGRSIEVGWQVMGLQYRDQAAMQRCDAAGIERHFLAR